MNPKRRYARRIVGAAQYDDVIGEAIRWFKFKGKTRLVEPLAGEMRVFAERELDDCYAAVIPVPLHRVRLRERGYNQAHLLAHELLPQFPGAKLVQALERIRPTRTQSTLREPAARRANVRGAFAVVPAAADRLSGNAVLLIDDVVTTGETVHECARVLRRAGVEAVDVFAAALAVDRLSQTPEPW